LKMGPIRYPEMSVKDYNSTLRNTTEDHSSHVLWTLEGPYWKL
jgi:hypothetical protein